MLMTLLLVVQVLVSIALIALILLQQGKGADAGAAFGSGASATVFGSRGSATFLTKTTTGLAVSFFVISLGLAYLASERPAERSVTDRLGGSEQVEGAEGDAGTQADSQRPDVPAPSGAEGGEDGGSDVPTLPDETGG